MNPLKPLQFSRPLTLPLGVDGAGQLQNITFQVTSRPVAVDALNAFDATLISGIENLLVEGRFAVHQLPEFTKLTGFLDRLEGDLAEIYSNVAQSQAADPTLPETPEEVEARIQSLALQCGEVIGVVRSAIEIYQQNAPLTPSVIEADHALGREINAARCALEFEQVADKICLYAAKFAIGAAPSAALTVGDLKQFDLPTVTQFLNAIEDFHAGHKPAN